MVEIQQVFAEATFCASFAEARHQDLFVEWILDPQRYASAIIPQGRELISSTRSLPDDCLEAASDGTHLLECAVEMAGVFQLAFLREHELCQHQEAHAVTNRSSRPSSLFHHRPSRGLRCGSPDQAMFNRVSRGFRRRATRSASVY